MGEPDLIGKIELNESPDLTMAEITQQMFNNEFMSDVEFHIDGKVIFAHSWELMKRSTVFRNQLRATMGENKLIPIDDTAYDVFYQFIRFIYTDNCEINDANHVELIKMTRKYRVIMLESKLMNETVASIKQLAYCVSEEYDIGYQMAREKLANNVFVLQTQIATVEPNVMEEILKFEYFAGLEEHDVFELFMSWINKPYGRRNSYFHKFIRLIPFPTMTADQFSICVKKYKDFFSDDVISKIFKQICLIPVYRDPWNSTPRLKSDNMFEDSEKIAINFQTVFHVYSIVILTGLRFGRHYTTYADPGFKIIAQEFEIIGKKTNMKKFYFNFMTSAGENNSVLVSLGESIVLKPQINYTIEVNSDNIPSGKWATDPLPVNRGIREVKIRSHLKDIILNGPPKVIWLTKSSPNLFEIIYKLRK